MMKFIMKNTYGERYVHPHIAKILLWVIAAVIFLGTGIICYVRGSFNQFLVFWGAALTVCFIIGFMGFISWLIASVANGKKLLGNGDDR